jgi:hypothetical protein
MMAHDLDWAGHVKSSAMLHEIILRSISLPIAR